MLQKGHPVKWIQQYSLDWVRKILSCIFFSLDFKVSTATSKLKAESRISKLERIEFREAWIKFHGSAYLQTLIRKYNLGKILGLWHPGQGCGKESYKQRKGDCLLTLLDWTWTLTMIACSQTLHFLFQVNRVRVIKEQKRRGIYWPPAQLGRGGGKRKQFFIFLSRTPRTLSLSSIALPPMFSKRTERKIRQHLCAGLRLPKVDHEIR